MRSRRLANTIDEVSRLLGGVTPPVIPDTLRGNTRITGRWFNSPYDGYVPGLDEHCLVCHFGGYSKAWARIDGKELNATLVPGTVTVVPRGDGGWRKSDGRIEVSNVFLGADRLQECADAIAHGRSPELIGRSSFDDPRLFAVMNLLSEEADLGGQCSRLFVEQAIDLLCVQLLRGHSSLERAPQSGPRRGLAPWQVKRVSAYMRDNLDQDIGLQELADVVGQGRFYFCHAFRLATGHTPYDWLTRLRIDKARELLAEPNLRIIDVALAVGYQTPSAFTARFRKLQGVTPSQYRSRL